ncbi:MAG: NlpC/P60 family protein [Caulobacterales bacterium]|nr:NlpC/P60 family protein [Caulobacterales bacterium]
MTPLPRAAIVAAAREWIGTPYMHQASLKGAGCDCLGLVRGLWRELVGPEPEPVPAYTPDWAERTGGESLREAARRHLVELPAAAARPGDILLFRIGVGAPAKHAGVLAARERLIHAYWSRAVTETALTPWWRRRIAHAFAFPGAED